MDGVAPDGPHSVASYRRWLAARPEREHWELIAGEPEMVERPCRRHQRIASNLVSLLKRALERHHPRLAAYHGIGVNLASALP